MMPLRKRLVPTSTALLPEEIGEVQQAAQAKRLTMSGFIRSAATKEASRVLRRLERRPRTAAA